MSFTPFENPEVMVLFDRYPPAIHARLMEIRQLIFDVASKRDGVGRIEETIKWGQPAYVTLETRAGSTIRIDRVKNQPTQYALYFNCQTTLVETFRELYPQLTYEGNRAMIFDTTHSLATETLKDCIGMALTYHLRKKGKRS